MADWSSASAQQTPEVAARLLNMRQAAAYLAWSYWTFRDYVLQGLIPVVELPPLRPREGERPRTSLRRMLVDVRDVDAFIDRLKSPATSAPPSDAQPARTVREGAAPRQPVAGTVRAQSAK